MEPYLRQNYVYNNYLENAYAEKSVTLRLYPWVIKNKMNLKPVP